MNARGETCLWRLLRESSNGIARDNYHPFRAKSIQHQLMRARSAKTLINQCQASKCGSNVVSSTKLIAIVCVAGCNFC